MDDDHKLYTADMDVSLDDAQGLRDLFMSLPNELKKVPGKTRYLVRIAGMEDVKKKRKVRVFRCDNGTLEIADENPKLQFALDASERNDYCLVFSLHDGHGIGSPHYLKVDYCWRALSEEIIINFQQGYFLLAGKALTRVTFAAGARPIPALKDRELGFDPASKMIEIPGTCRTPIPVLKTGYE